MAASWEEVDIASLAAPSHGSVAVGPFGSRMKADLYTPTGVRIIRGNNLGDGIQLKPGFVFVPPAVADSMPSCCLKPGDLVFPHRGNIGEVGIVPGDSHRYMLSTSLMKLSPDRDKVDPLYLFYFFKSDIGRQALLMNASQVGTPGISTPLKSLKEIRLLLPGLKAQKSVVETLSTLDDKIALLRETNATLEAIAQALFKSWFVDFDPVRAKAEGRDPEGVPPEVADLFPSEFEDSELGAIPKGWRVALLAEHLDVVRGLSYKGSGLTDSDDPDGVPMHNLNSVLEGGGYKYAGLKFYKGEFKQKHEIKPWDIIVANTEQGHKHLLIGFPAVVPITQRRPGLFSHHLYRIRPLLRSPLGNLFLYRLLLVPSVREQVIGCSNGTTVNMLKADGLAMPRFVCPPRLLVEAFERIAGPIQARQEQNVATAENLASLRDSILPRLMSGKLHIGEITSNAEGVL